LYRRWRFSETDYEWTTAGWPVTRTPQLVYIHNIIRISHVNVITIIAQLQHSIKLYGVRAPCDGCGLGSRSSDAWWERSGQRVYYNNMYLPVTSLCRCNNIILLSSAKFSLCHHAHLLGFSLNQLIIPIHYIIWYTANCRTVKPITCI